MPKLGQAYFGLYQRQRRPAHDNCLVASTARIRLHVDRLAGKHQYGPRDVELQAVGQTLSVYEHHD